MKPIDKLLDNMMETVNATLGRAPVQAPTSTAGPLDGWRNDRGVGLLSLSRIVRDPDQPRKDFNAEELAGLETSIKTHGILQPVIVRWCAELEAWMLIDGERRFLCATALGLPSMPARKIEGELSCDDVVLHRAAAQLQKADWNPMEEALFLSNAGVTRNWNGREVSKALGLTEMRVSRAFALARDLAPDLQERVRSGEIAAMVGVELSKLPPDDARELAKDHLTKRKAQLEVAKRKPPMQQRKKRGAVDVAPIPTPPRSVTKMPFKSMGGGVVIVEANLASGMEVVKAALQELLRGLEKGEAA